MSDVKTVRSVEAVKQTKDGLVSDATYLRACIRELEDRLDVIEAMVEDDIPADALFAISHELRDAKTVADNAMREHTLLYCDNCDDSLRFDQMATGLCSACEKEARG